MVIPVIFKADGGDSSKKGKIRAEDLSVLNAFCLPKKTGLLNVLNKCDAYNLTPSSPDTFFYLHSGYVVICGRLVYIEEATQCSIALPVSGTETGYFGIKIDLSATEGDECKLFQKTGTLIQNDLNENPVSGVYEFPLFRYTATSSTVTALTKISELVERAESIVPTLANTAIYTSDRNGEPDMSLTIDEKFDDVKARLDTLGFKTGGSVTPGARVTITSQSITRQGNYVIGKVEGYATLGASYSLGTVFTIPENFRPATNITGLYGFTGTSKNVASTATISTSGVVTLSPTLYGSELGGRVNFSLVFGFLAPAWIE